MKTEEINKLTVLMRKLEKEHDPADFVVDAIKKVKYFISVVTEEIDDLDTDNSDARRIRLLSTKEVIDEIRNYPTGEKRERLLRELEFRNDEYWSV